MKTLCFVSAVVFFNQKYLLLHRHDHHHYSSNEWEFVSGTLDTHESGEEIAFREVVEETGLIGNIVKTGEIITYLEKDIRWLVIPYLIKVNTDFVKMSDEHDKYSWMTKDEICKLKNLGEEKLLVQILNNLT